MIDLSHFILGSMVLLIQQYADLYQKTDLHATLKEIEDDLSLPNVKTYDFIVVGGGSAGSVVAERLSERFTVLLLEKGGTPPPATDNPTHKGPIIFHPAINDAWKSTKQEHFALGTGGINTHFLGRMLGGCGSHNGNIYNRGNPRDYNTWAEMTNDPSWAYENVIKYYKRFENFVGRLINEDERDVYYARGGPLTVTTDTPTYLPMWMAAGAELGFPANDANGFQCESFNPMVKSAYNGMRVSGYTAFIKPIEGKRPTLTVHRYSLADQILISEDRTAYGVRYLRHDIPQIALVSREVIISAGAVASPVLLVKSGIGPASFLKSVNIPVISDLPGVGGTYLDHVGKWLFFKTHNPAAYDAIFPHMNTDFEVITELNKYQSPHRSGNFDHSIGPQAFLVSSAAKARGEHDWPDIQLTMSRFDDLADKSRSFAICVMLGRTQSRGRIVFNKTAFLNDEKDDVKLAQVDFAFFTHPTDLDVMAEGIQFVSNMVRNTVAFAPLNATHIEPSPEGCKLYPFGSNEFWKCVVQYTTVSMWHMTSTCKMGVASDPNAVVDTKLKVRGVRGLRVVDPSVYPFPTNSNLNAAVFMVGEKGTSDIIEEHLGRGVG